MKTLLITQDDMHRIIREAGRSEILNRIISRITEGLRDGYREGLALSPLRDGFERPSPAPGITEWMPHRVAGESITIKTVSYSPGNPALFGLPTILGTITRFDDTTGRLVAVADGVLPTALRTGAASAVASRALADPGSRVLGLIGTGAQAVTQLHALSLVLPLDTVLAWDTDPAHLASFAERVAFLGMDVRTATPEEIRRDADVISTVTSVGVGQGPVLPDGPTREHLHINAVGSDLIGKTELPRSLLLRALVCPDHPEQTLREGESQQLTAAQQGPELRRLCAEPETALAARSRLTVFDSTGIAYLDHLALDVFLEAAAELGAGTAIALEHYPSDALDPYSAQAGSDIELRELVDAR
ncbi:ornithine cyclodeaminase family protein [Streptomyces sp. ACA25]|uniref:ornithine cyclodeaminase family protein n=1 Tax=Streptomyces sp. ACA25 TaxID=3022596 RepID=UPI002307CEB8|nr:ornithine cyclodeaminase family protein [Streptomyces sp. ACA25]MDB1089560.1 ornithine cyclodeaminase family protein [Streptomyces sp. ACA25]